MGMVVLYGLSGSLAAGAIAAVLCLTLSVPLAVLACPQFAGPLSLAAFAAAFALQFAGLLADVRSGQVLKVVATDPGSVKDFETFAKQTGHQLLSHGEANGEFTFLMKKK